ncbi:MAG: hypothetical protein Q8916_08440 [Bacteroidota bacterium]|nr:hypothetical protein [Bacteroidota bacterium]
MPLNKPHSFKKALLGAGKNAINATFRAAIMPDLLSEIDWQEHLKSKFFKKKGNETLCIYCETKIANCWDHFYSVRSKDKGIINANSITNLVPACGSCNDSRGNKDWRKWIESSAKGSPKSKRVNRRKLNAIICNIQNYEKTYRQSFVNYQKLLSHKDNKKLLGLNRKYEGFRSKILMILEDAQATANDIRMILETKEKTKVQRQK